MGQKLAALLRHSRPRFWLYTAGPFLVGYAAGIGGPLDLLSPLFLYGLLYFLLPANVFLYGLNDVFDLDTDVHNPKKMGPEALALGRRGLLAAASLASALAAAPLAVDPTAALLVGLYLALSAAYSVPPVRLKARPLLDSYSNWLYIVPAALGYHLSAGRLMPPWAWAAGVLWTAAMHALSAVPDIESDRKAGVRTVAVLLGRRGTLAFVATNWAAAAALLTARDPLLAPSILYPAIALYLLARPHLVELWYWRFPLINALMGMGAFLYAARPWTWLPYF